MNICINTFQIQIIDTKGPEEGKGVGRGTKQRKEWRAKTKTKRKHPKKTGNMGRRWEGQRYQLDEKKKEVVFVGWRLHVEGSHFEKYLE